MISTLLTCCILTPSNSKRIYLMPSSGKSKPNLRLIETGRWGENFAVRILQEKGLKLLARNVRTPYGELDLVATTGDNIVFIEVKTRFSERFGTPEEAITETKKKHLINAAEAFLQDHPELEGDWQIDVITILCTDQKSAPIVNWIENAIS